MIRKITIYCLAAVMSLTQLMPLYASTKLWEKPLDKKMVWSKVTSYGTILVGSKSSLASYHPETGELLWKKEGIKNIAPFDVHEAQGQPILVIGMDKGLGGGKTVVQAVHLDDGRTLWKTDVLKGAPYGVYNVPSKNMVLLFINHISTVKGEEQGLYIYAYDVVSGEVIWKSLYKKKASAINTYMADNSGAFSVRLDYSGYHPPVIEGDAAYLTFDGLEKLDLNTGEIVWAVPFKTFHKKFKKAYASPYIDGDTVYVSGKSVIYAVDKNSGALQWETEKIFSGLIAQIIVTDKMLLARIGGNFLSNTPKEGYVPDKPFKVKAYDKTNGQVLWEFSGIKGGITNMVYLPKLNIVMLADAKSLIGIDAQSAGKVKETFRLPLKFKRKVGVTDAASLGVKTLTGGAFGLLKGVGKMAIGKERQDPPVVIIPQDNGSVVVRGQQHILSFDPATQTINWSVSYAAPGASKLGLTALAAVSAFAVLGTQVSYASGATSAHSASQHIDRYLNRMDSQFDKRFSKTQSTRKNAYILTNVTGGVGIMAINLDTGETEDEFLFNSKSPHYVIDEAAGRIYFFKKKKNIAAFDMN